MATMATKGPVIPVVVIGRKDAKPRWARAVPKGRNPRNPRDGRARGQGERGSRRRRPGALVSALLVALLLAASPARAESVAREGGLAAASLLSSLVYGPVKLTYATLGLVGAGFAYAFSGGDHDVAGPVLDASVRGDWVLTPRHLTGDEEIEFIGRRPADRAARERFGDAAAEPEEPPAEEPAF